MIRFEKPSYLSGVTPTSTTKTSSSPSSAIPAGDSDQVDLSAAASVIPEGRAAQIAALKKLYDSSDYLPPALPVSQKLVADALSRSI